MKILALDTSQIQATVCLISDEKLVAERSGGVSVAHSEGLMVLVDELLKSTKTSLENIDAFAVGIGPGSFTGLRIGCATIKSLAQVLNKPILPFSSLKALGFSAQEKGEVVAMANAYQAQVFVSWNSFSKEDVMEPSAWCKEHFSPLKAPVFFCGNGAKLFWSQIEPLVSGAKLSSVEFINAQGILATIRNEIATLPADRLLLRYAHLHANYLRPSQAEIKLDAAIANRVAK